MTLQLDMTTLVINACVAAGFSMIAMYYVWRVHHRDVAIRYWWLSFLTLGLAAALIAAHDTLHTAITVAVANVVTVTGFVLMRAGTARFARRAPRWGLAIALIATVAVVSTVWGVLFSDYRVRAVAFGLAVSTVLMLIVGDLWAARHGQQRSIVVSMAVLFALAALMTAVRSVNALQTAAVDTLFRGGPIEALWFLVGHALIFFAPFGFLLMTSQRLQLRLDRLANEDELTGVLNRRAFLAQALELLSDQRRRGEAAILVLDLDHFKQLNDGHGHAAGDAVLRTFARTVASQLRPRDLFARVGGEEFWALLPDTDLAGARALAERLRSAVERQGLRYGNTRLDTTVSVGISLVREADLSSALSAADRALYEAKNGGRNRVIAERHVA